MQKTTNTSESLVGNICQEIESIRVRSRYLLNVMVNCKDLGLTLRLKSELNQLTERRFEILKAAKTMKGEELLDQTSIEFLIELCRRT